jgi:hypothetical protein
VALADGILQLELRESLTGSLHRVEKTFQPKIKKMVKYEN